MEDDWGKANYRGYRERNGYWINLNYASTYRERGIYSWLKKEKYVSRYKSTIRECSLLTNDLLKENYLYNGKYNLYIIKNNLSFYLCVTNSFELLCLLNWTKKNLYDVIYLFIYLFIFLFRFCFSQYNLIQPKETQVYS